MGEEDGEEGDDKENVDGENVKVEKDIKKERVEKTEAEIAAEYGLDDYDDEEEGGAAALLGVGDLTTFANPADDPYLSAMDQQLGEEDEEDREDFKIRGTDNMIVAAHV